MKYNDDAPHLDEFFSVRIYYLPAYDSCCHLEIDKAKITMLADLTLGTTPVDRCVHAYTIISK